MILNLHQFEYTIGAESSMAEWNWRQSTAWWEIIGAWLSLAHNSALIFQKILNIMNTFGQGFSGVLLGENLFWPDCLGPAGHSFFMSRRTFPGGVLCLCAEDRVILFFLCSFRVWTLIWAHLQIITGLLPKSVKMFTGVSGFTQGGYSKRTGVSRGAKHPTCK